MDDRNKPPTPYHSLDDPRTWKCLPNKVFVWASPDEMERLGLVAEPDPEEHLREVINDWCVGMQLEGMQPVVAASNLLGVLVSVLETSMGRGAIRTAMLMVYEASHEQPMSFIERADAKKVLDQVSNLRRSLSGKPHLIIPGGSDVV